MTFTFAGHETTSLAWTSGVLLLVRPDDVLEVLRAVVEEVGDRRPQADDVPELGLCDNVIDEAMGLYLPIPTLSREATARIQIGGYRIDPGTIVILPQYPSNVTNGLGGAEPIRSRPPRS